MSVPQGSVARHLVGFPTGIRCAAAQMSREHNFFPGRRDLDSDWCHGFDNHIGNFEAAEFIRSSTRAHITARELASPPFEDDYLRACADRVTPNQR
jgi:hypothetical protein